MKRKIVTFVTAPQGTATHGQRGSTARLDEFRTGHEPGRSQPVGARLRPRLQFIPAEFGTLGLEAAELDRHIAWDPGALPVAGAWPRARCGAGRSPAFRGWSSTATGRSMRPTSSRRSAKTTAIPGNRNLAADETRTAHRTGATSLSMTPSTAWSRSGWRPGGRRGWFRSTPSRRSIRACAGPGTSASSTTTTGGWPQPLIAALQRDEA